MKYRTLGLYLGISAGLVLLGASIKKLTDGDLGGLVEGTLVATGTVLSLGSIIKKGITDGANGTPVQYASKTEIY